jgi:hypothetical protein
LIVERGNIEHRTLNAERRRQGSCVIALISFMAKGKNKDYVSFWFWLFALLVVGIPCIGWIMIIVWAFVGTNESRKNYFRALIIWFVVIAAISFALAALGFLPLMEKQIEMWMQRNGNIQQPASHGQHPR